MKFEHVQGQVKRLKKAIRRRGSKVPLLLLVTQSAYEKSGIHDRGGGGGVRGNDMVDEVVNGSEVIPLAQSTIKVLPLIFA